MNCLTEAAGFRVTNEIAPESDSSKKELSAGVKLGSAVPFLLYSYCRVNFIESFDAGA